MTSAIGRKVTIANDSQGATTLSCETEKAHDETIAKQGTSLQGGTG